MPELIDLIEQIIRKLLKNPFYLLMGLISLLLVSEYDIAAYLAVGVAESTGHTFMSSVILYFMDLLGDITTFLFNALINIVVWIMVIAIIARIFYKPIKKILKIF